MNLLVCCCWRVFELSIWMLDGMFWIFFVFCLWVVMMILFRVGFLVFLLFVVCVMVLLLDRMNRVYSVVVIWKIWCMILKFFFDIGEYFGFVSVGYLVCLFEEEGIGMFCGVYSVIDIFLWRLDFVFVLLWYCNLVG